MKTLIFTGAAALLSILACSAPSAAADPLVLSDIRWIAESAGGKNGVPRVRMQHEKSSSDQNFDGSRPHFAAAEAALGRTTPGPVSFTVTHGAGTLACSGTLARAFEGSGKCRFTSDPAFERALGARKLAPDERSTLLAMLLVDASIELADGLTREGVRPQNANDLIAAAALDVRPEYIRDLKSETLVLTDIDDAIACKALGVDGAYIRGLAAAGYRKLSTEDAVGMKAMGITGDYALAMNRAVGGISQ